MISITVTVKACPTDSDGQRWRNQCQTAGVKHRP